MTNSTEETPTRAEPFGEKIKYASICFAIFSICYGYEITNFNLSIDEEILAFSKPNWLAIGRWALQLITNAFWPQPTTPFGPFILFGLLGSISYIILLNAFEIKNPRLVHFIIFPIFIAFPVWPTQIEFSSNIIGCGIALLLISIAALFSKDQQKKQGPCDAQQKENDKLPRKILAATAVTIAIGIYQSFVFLYIILGTAVCLNFYTTNDEPLKLYLQKIVGVLIIAFMAFTFSATINILLMSILHVEQSQYADSFLNINKLIEQPLDTLTITSKQVIKIYFTYWSQFGFAKYVFALAIFFGATAPLLEQRTRSPLKNFVTLSSLALIAIAPFSLNPFMGGELPVRTFVAIPTSVWLFTFLPVARPQPKKTELFVLAIGIVAFTQILYIQSLIQARSWAVRQHDILLASSIYNKIIEANNPDPDNAPIKLEISGTKKPNIPYPTIDSATNGASFFEWDNGNKFRIIAFMNLIGFDRIIPATKDECTGLLPELSLMPSWPAAGSVRLVRKVILVKLSNEQPIVCK